VGAQQIVGSKVAHAFDRHAQPAVFHRKIRAVSYQVVHYFFVDIFYFVLLFRAEFREIEIGAGGDAYLRHTLHYRFIRFRRRVDNHQAVEIVEKFIYRHGGNFAVRITTWSGRIALCGKGRASV